MRIHFLTLTERFVCRPHDPVLSPRNKEIPIAFDPYPLNSHRLTFFLWLLLFLRGRVLGTETSLGSEALEMRALGVID